NGEWRAIYHSPRTPVPGRPHQADRGGRPGIAGCRAPAMSQMARPRGPPQVDGWPRAHLQDATAGTTRPDLSPHRPKGDDMSTIVLIHGLWLTPRSWEYWKARFEQRGHEVLAPAWPRMESEVEALRRNPSVMDGLGVTE